MKQVKMDFSEVLDHNIHLVGSDSIRCYHQISDEDQMGEGYEFDLRFIEITQRSYRNKPVGAFWCSPVGSEYGWYEFTSQDGFKYSPYYVEFDIDVSKIFIIDLHWRYNFNTPIMEEGCMYCIDYLELWKMGFRGVYNKNRWMPPYTIDMRCNDGIVSVDFCGWDCESIALFSRGSISNIGEIKKRKV